MADPAAMLCSRGRAVLHYALFQETALPALLYRHAGRDARRRVVRLSVDAGKQMATQYSWLLKVRLIGALRAARA